MNENVRKVFDILGVEPNEEFNFIYTGEKIFYVDENLSAKEVEKENSKGFLYVDNMLPLFLKNPEKIIHLPKKKKLRDLTVEEYHKWECNVCIKISHCNNDCIFKNVPCDSCNERCWIHHKDLYSDKFLDQEIEVE